MPTPTFAELYPFTAHFFAHPPSAAIKQHYVDEGDGEIIVMLHGNPTWSFFYRDLIQHFRGNYRVIAPDHVGMGFSDKPQNYPYTLAQHCANLSALLNAVTAPNAKITLIMHDWGGAIGCGWAGQNPDRVAKIILLNTAAFPLPSIPLRINVCKIPYLGDLLIRGGNAFARGATRMTTVKPLSPAIKAGFLLPYNSWAARIATLRFVQDIPLSPAHPTYSVLKNIEAHLPRLRNVPILLQWGARDWCFHDLFYQRWLQIFPHAHADYYANAGHYLLEDHGAVIAARISEFISKAHQCL